MTAQIIIMEKKKKKKLFYYIICHISKENLQKLSFVSEIVVCVTLVVVVVTLFLVHELLLRQMCCFFTTEMSLAKSGKERQNLTKYPKLKLTFGEVCANCGPAVAASACACNSGFFFLLVHLFGCFRLTHLITCERHTPTDDTAIDHTGTGCPCFFLFVFCVVK